MQLRNGTISLKGKSANAGYQVIVEECQRFFTKLRVDYRCDIDFPAVKSRVEQILQRGRERRLGSALAVYSQERLDYYYDLLADVMEEYSSSPTDPQFASAVTALQNAALADPLLTELENAEFWDAGEVAKDSYAYWPQESSMQPIYDQSTGDKRSFLDWFACMIKPEQLIGIGMSDIVGAAAGSLGLAWVFGVACAVLG